MQLLLVARGWCCLLTEPLQAVGAPTLTYVGMGAGGLPQCVTPADMMCWRGLIRWCARDWVSGKAQVAGAGWLAGQASHYERGESAL